MTYYEVRPAEKWSEWDDDRCSLIRASDGSEIMTDGGEPEDATFTRDYAPVVDELNSLATQLAEERARVERLKSELTEWVEALQRVIAVSDRETDPYIAARALLTDTIKASGE